MLPTSANSSSSVNDCGASVYNSEADLAFIHTAECVYTEWHFCMRDPPPSPLSPLYWGGWTLSVCLSDSTTDVDVDTARERVGRTEKR